MEHLTHEQVSQDLIWAGLGNYNKPDDYPKTFEAYGDGKLNVVKVLKDGTTVFVDHKGKDLHRGMMSDSEQILDLLDKYGHHADC